MLSRAQIDEYHEQGYIVVPDLVDPSTLASMKTVLAEFVEASRTVNSNNEVFDLEPGHTSTEPRVRRIKMPTKLHPVFLDFARSGRLVGAVQALLGQEAARLRESKINLKAPRFGSPVEWHQDWAFYPHTNDDILAVGVMLEDTVIENGAMYVIPESHKGPTYNHQDPDGYFCGAIDPAEYQVDMAKAVALEGKAGACTFHHARLIHGSAQNLSARPRPFLLYEIAAADAFPLMGPGDYDDFHGRMLFGADTKIPRYREAPARMPIPWARSTGSIYEIQKGARSPRFERTDLPTTEDSAVA